MLSLSAQLSDATSYGADLALSNNNKAPKGYSTDPNDVRARMFHNDGGYEPGGVRYIDPETGSATKDRRSFTERPEFYGRLASAAAASGIIDFSPSINIDDIRDAIAGSMSNFNQSVEEVQQLDARSEKLTEKIRQGNIHDPSDPAYHAFDEANEITNEKVRTENEAIDELESSIDKAAGKIISDLPQYEIEGQIRAVLRNNPDNIEISAGAQAAADIVAENFTGDPAALERYASELANGIGYEANMESMQPGMPGMVGGATGAMMMSPYEAGIPPVAGNLATAPDTGATASVASDFGSTDGPPTNEAVGGNDLSSASAFGAATGITNTGTPEVMNPDDLALATIAQYPPHAMAM